jgi:hypothetical protein
MFRTKGGLVQTWRHANRCRSAHGALRALQGRRRRIYSRASVPNEIAVKRVGAVGDAGHAFPGWPSRRTLAEQNTNRRADGAPRQDTSSRERNPMLRRVLDLAIVVALIAGCATRPVGPPDNRPTDVIFEDDKGFRVNCSRDARQQASGASLGFHPAPIYFQSLRECIDRHRLWRDRCVQGC